MKVPEKNTNDIIVAPPAPLEAVLVEINEEPASIPKSVNKKETLPPKITMVG